MTRPTRALAVAFVLATTALTPVLARFRPPAAEHVGRHGGRSRAYDDADPLVRGGRSYGGSDAERPPRSQNEIHPMIELIWKAGLASRGRPSLPSPGRSEPSGSWHPALQSGRNRRRHRPGHDVARATVRRQLLADVGGGPTRRGGQQRRQATRIAAGPTSDSRPSDVVLDTEVPHQ